MNKLPDENRNLKATMVINKMLESKVENYESRIRELEEKSKNHNCQSHIYEIKTLKLKLQNLETENRALRSLNESKNVIKLDPYLHFQASDQSRDLECDKLGL